MKRFFAILAALAALPFLSLGQVANVQYNPSTGALSSTFGTLPGQVGYNVPSGGIIEIKSGATIQADAGSTITGWPSGAQISGTPTANQLAVWLNATTLEGVAAGTVVPTSIVGTANEVIVSNPTGTVTLSTPQAIGTGSDVNFHSVTASNTGGTYMYSLTSSGSGGHSYGLWIDGTAFAVDDITNGVTRLAIESNGQPIFSYFNAAGLLVTNAIGAESVIPSGANGSFLGVAAGVLGFYTPSGAGNVSTSGSITSGYTAEWNGATTIIAVANTGTGNYVKSASPTLSGTVGISGVAGTLAIAPTTAQSSGQFYGATINPTIAQTGTAGFITLDLAVTQTSFGSGTNYLIYAPSVFTVDYSGNIVANSLTGQGTNQPLKLSATGTGLVDIINGSPNAGLQIWGNSGGGLVQWLASGGQTYFDYQGTLNLRAGVGGTTEAALTAAGVFSVVSIQNTPTGTVTPAAGAFTTLSASGQITSTETTGTAPFVVASTTVVPNLSVNVASAGDYSTGTWTPGLVGFTVAGGSASATGTYVRIGKMVHLTIQITGTGTIAATTVTSTITGAPYSNANNTSGTYELGAVSGFGGVEMTLGVIYPNTFGASSLTNGIIIDVTYIST